MISQALKRTTMFTLRTGTRPFRRSVLNIFRCRNVGKNDHLRRLSQPFRRKLQLAFSFSETSKNGHDMRTLTGPIHISGGNFTGAEKWEKWSFRDRYAGCLAGGENTLSHSPKRP